MSPNKDTPPFKRRPGPHAQQNTSLKMALIVICIFLGGALLYWPEIEDFFTSMRTQDHKKAQALEERTKVAAKEIVLPKFMSTDAKQRPYVIESERAINQSEELVVLEKVQSSMTLDEGAHMEVSADTGLITPNDTGVADLHDHVCVTHSNGYTVTTDKAHVDFSKKTIDSATPVKGSSPHDHFEGEGMHLDDEAQKLCLKGKSRITFADAPKTQTPGATR